MAEGARLESVYTGNRIVGSNPTPSRSRLSANDNLGLEPVWKRYKTILVSDGGAIAPSPSSAIQLAISGITGD